ncbi:MAG: N-6 DNA methylase [Candidatus Thermoplasmatota archaeon]
MNEKQIKAELQELIEDFKEHYEQYKKELEANTETKLVEPLFELLGWTKKDFVKQEKARRETRMGHADYAFYIGDKIVFFLEVKKVGIPLEREADKQVISYALSKRVSFAVSTNFEELKIFCVEQEDALRNKFRVFNSPDDYISNFEDLLYLSKESFEQGLTLKKAESEGRLKRRVSIDRSLLEDLMHIRSLIASDIEKSYPGKYQINEKDEIIQRIIDRLIFIRRCEDTGINPENVSLKEVQDHPTNKVYPLLKEIFKRYNDVYNSGLFAIAKDNDCDKISIDGEIIKKLTQYLYESKDGEYIYNFDWIDADVLGQVYEQYLGKLLAQTKSGKAKLTNGQAHRKEQGIYYTPTYIVDYIVKNTVGELLKNKKTKVKDLKILDPACGSGSFLIKAFDCLHNHLSGGKESKQYRIDSQGKYSIKTEILKNNLYGVDLDNKAVEITKLNLLLKATEKDRRLPEEVDVHIKHGNSLIDDETVVGLNAFKWEEQFKEIMRKGGFDVAIGNPPYISNWQLSETNREMVLYLDKKYEDITIGHWDIYILFIRKALSLLKEDGYLSFIVPSSFAKEKYGKLLREFIVRNHTLVSLAEFGAETVFKDVARQYIIFVIQKKKPRSQRTNIIIFKDFQFQKIGTISQRNFLDFHNCTFRTDLDDKKIHLLKKMSSTDCFIGNICCVNVGVVAHSREGARSEFAKGDVVHEEYKPGYKKYLEGKDIARYVYNWKKLYMDYDSKAEDFHRPKFPELFEGNKIIIRRVSGENNSLIAIYDDSKFYTNDNLIIILPWNDRLLELQSAEKKWPVFTPYNYFSLKYILGILNSKLMSFYFSNMVATGTLQGTYSGVYPEDVRSLPIPKVPSAQQQLLIKLVDRMILFNNRLKEIGDKKTSESAKLEEEIKNTDNDIDQIVYKLYGLSKKEIAIVEESLKN